jgi:hypothetical protein
MDIYHQDPGFVSDQRQSMVQARFDVNRLVLHAEAQVVVEFVLTPFWPRFWHLIDDAAGSDVFVHQSPQLLECKVVEFFLDPTMRLL